MSKTRIEWTDFSWNPTTGCTMGCRNCYARRWTNRMKKVWGYDFAPQLHPKRLTKHDNWPDGSKVFVCDMGDLFDNQITYKWIDRVFKVIREYPQVTFQLLTKRVSRMVAYAGYYKAVRGSLPSNIWWGGTVRNQEEADLHLPELLKLKALGASVVYISAEPLLGPIDTTRWLSREGYGSGARVLREQFDGLDWVICGGETGPGARPMHPSWARSLRDQCVEAGVPFFFKAWGEWAPIEEPGYIGNQASNYYRFDEGGQWMFKTGRKKAGRLLDGREWSEFPK